MMNYNEFKATKCAKCENNCATGYGCEFTEDYMIYVKEEKKMKAIEINNVNSIKEEKKMTYAELKAEKARRREVKIDKILAKATDTYQYPIAVKNRSREQEPVQLKDLRFWYNLAHKSEHIGKFNSLLYRLKHGAALIDDNNNVIYQEDEGYYACMLTSKTRYRRADQHLVPKCPDRRTAVGIVVDYCEGMNKNYTGKFLNEIYKKICGVGLVNYKDEGFGAWDELKGHAAQYTLDDTLLLRDFDVYAPRVSIFNGYLNTHIPFVEVTTCSENIDEIYGCNYLVFTQPTRFVINYSYAKGSGYHTSPISTANYRAYAPKDERLSYQAEKKLELGWSDRETERGADYDDYLDHSEMGMFDKGITHELADAWREFTATLSEENKEFFGIHDNPQGMTEYDPEQEGFAFPYPASRDVDEDEFEYNCKKLLAALDASIVKPNF